MRAEAVQMILAGITLSEVQRRTGLSRWEIQLAARRARSGAVSLKQARRIAAGEPAPEVERVDLRKREFRAARAGLDGVMPKTREYMRAHKAYQRAQWRARGLCRECGAEPAVNDRGRVLTLCQEHRERVNRAMRERYEPKGGGTSYSTVIGSPEASSEKEDALDAELAALGWRWDDGLDRWVKSG